MHIKTFFKNLKKRASGSVETAIIVHRAWSIATNILSADTEIVAGEYYIVSV